MARIDQVVGMIAGLVVLAILGAPADAMAQGVAPVQPSIYWGGRTVSVDVDPANPARACAATDYGGVFCTTDSGASWQHSDALIPAQVTDIAISHSDPNLLLVTAIEDSRTTITPGGAAGNAGGIWRSTDFGLSWQRPTNAIPTDSGGTVRIRHSAYEIAIEAGTSNVYIGTDFGLAVSDDDGASFSHVSIATTDVVVSSVIAAGGIIDALSAGGTHYRSDPAVSAGAWVANALPSSPRVTFGRYEIHALARSPLQSDVLFAAVQNGAVSGFAIFESDDAGATWTNLNAPTRDLNRVGFAIASPAYNGDANFDIWYSDGVNMHTQQCGLANASTACGVGAFQFINLRPNDPGADPEGAGPVPHNDPSDLVFAKNSVPLCADGDAQDGRVIPAFLATDGGVGTSPCGLDWDIVGAGGGGFNALQLYQITGQVHGDGSPTYLYFATQDNDLWASTDGGLTWPRNVEFEGFGVEIPRFSQTPTNPVVTGSRCGPCRNFVGDFALATWGDNWVDPPGSTSSTAVALPQSCPDADSDGLCDAATGCALQPSGVTTCQAGCTDGGSIVGSPTDGICDGIPCQAAGASLLCQAAGGRPGPQFIAPQVLPDGTYVQLSDQGSMQLATGATQWTFYRSTDSGLTWQPIPGSEVVTGSLRGQIIVEGPANDATLYVGDNASDPVQLAGLPASATVTTLATPGTILDYTPLFLGGTLALGVDPKNPRSHLMAALDDGTMRSFNTAAATWDNTAAMQELTTLVTANGTFAFNTTSLVNGSSTDQSQVTTIAFDPMSPTILVGTLDAGIISSLDDGATWGRVCGSERIPKITSFFFDEGCTGATCAPAQPPATYVASYGRGLWTVDAADQQIPTFTATSPDELVFDCGPVQLDEPAATDTCGNLPVTISAVADRPDFEVPPSCEDAANRAAGPCGYFQRGTTTVTWTAADAGGGSITDTSTVTVNDTTPPVFDPFETVVSEVICDGAGSTVVLTVPTATDRCDVMVTVSGVVIESSSVGVPLAIDEDGAVALAAGTHVIEWTASDGINEEKAEQTVVVYPGLFANRNFLIEDRGEVLSSDGYSSVANAGNGLTRVGNDAFSGAVQSVARVELRDRSTVGFVTSSGSITEFNDVDHGLLSPFTAVALPGFPSLAGVVFPGGTNHTVNANATLPLAPGSYGQVTLNSQSELHLTSGTYYFTAFTANSDTASTVIDDSAGPVYIYVRDSVAYRGEFVHGDDSLAAVFLGYAGTQQVTLEAEFLGAVLAPNAVLAMGTGNAVEFTGNFAARDIVVRPGADLVCLTSEESFVGFVVGTPPVGPTCSDGVENGTETDVDCGGVCADCALGKGCLVAADCASGTCVGQVCVNPPPACTAATATDLGPPGTNRTVSTNACLRVQNGYPSWWDTRSMNLQTTTGTGYPIGYTWSNSCTGASGSGTISWNWQSSIFGPTNENCPTVIKLTGGPGSVTLRYWAN